MRHLLPIGALTLLTLLGTSSAHAAWVLPPHAASAVKRAVNVKAKPDAKGLTRSAKLDKDTIAVVAKDGDGTVVMAVTLVHPSVAPEGAFQAAGVALLETPGPAKADVLAMLKTSLGAAKKAIPWVETQDEEPGEGEDTEALAAAAIDRALASLDAGADATQTRASLDALPSPLPPALAARVAVGWHRIGDTKKAQETLANLGADEPWVRAAAAAIQGKPIVPATVLKGVDNDKVCTFKEVSDILAALGRSDEALALATATLAGAEGCPAAWETAIHRHNEARDRTTAVDLADRAMKRFTPKEASDGLLATVGSTYLAAGRDLEATQTLEVVAQRNPADEQTVRMLISAMLREAKERPAHIARLEKRHASEPANQLVQLLLAIVIHYENRFEESNALLAPLEATMGAQSRWHIYRALNDFNLSKVDAAVARLDELTKRPSPDPYAFYCRAEFLRDTDRAAARADLVRYQTMSRRNGSARSSRDAQIAEFIQLLDTCLESGATKCRGKWENPRIRLDTWPPDDGKADAEVDKNVDAQGVRWPKPVHTVNIVIDVATSPDDYGGNLFLVGYWDLNIGGLPVDHLQIAHYHQLAMWLQRFPYRTKVQLVEGIHYRAVYSHNDFPLLTDAVSNFFQIGSEPPDLVSVVVNRYGHERNDGETGKTPVLNWKANAAAGPKMTPVMVHIDPPPKDTSGKVFVAGFKTINPQTGMPTRDQLPSDYHTIKGVDDGLPVRTKLPLVEGLHYLAMYGFGMFPGDGDRLSQTTVFRGESNVSFTVRDTMIPTQRSAPSPIYSPSRSSGHESSAKHAQSRTWTALMLGLAAALGILLLARRRKKKPKP